MKLFLGFFQCLMAASWALLSITEQPDDVGWENKFCLVCFAVSALTAIYLFCLGR